MSEHSLNAGQGLCPATACVLIKPVQAVIELGALPDVMNTALWAVHSANRTGPADDFIAVALPEMRTSWRGTQTGTSIVLTGSEQALARYIASDRISTLMRRGMIVSPEITEPVMEIGDECAAYVRDRGIEKHTTGWEARNRRRAERRGKLLGRKQKRDAISSDAVAIRYGDVTLHVRRVVGILTGEPLDVSTYGFSLASAPAVLPVNFTADIPVALTDAA